MKLDLPTGVYLIVVEHGNGNKLVRRLVKEMSDQLLFQKAKGLPLYQNQLNLLLNSFLRYQKPFTS